MNVIKNIAYHIAFCSLLSTNAQYIDVIKKSSAMGSVVALYCFMFSILISDDLRNPDAYWTYMNAEKTDYLNCENTENFGKCFVKDMQENAKFLNKFPTQASYLNTPYLRRVAYYLLSRPEKKIIPCGYMFFVGFMTYCIQEMFDIKKMIN